MNFQRILVALDDSDLSKEVFSYALGIAKSSHARLKLFNCISINFVTQPLNVSADVGLYPDLLNSNYPEQQMAIDLQVDRVKAFLQVYGEAAQRQGVITETECKIGETGPLLCETAEAFGADLIVVGRRGRKGLSEALLGSVSNYVLHHAHCSVLAVQGDAVSHPE